MYNAGYTTSSTPTPDALDPELQDNGFEAEPRLDSPESEPNVVDVDTALDGILVKTETYWQTAEAAGVLKSSERQSFSFFNQQNAPECLQTDEGKPALSTDERQTLLEKKQADRANESGETGDKERRANVRTMAEIALVQAFSDLALFRSSVLAELKAASSDYLSASISTGIPGSVLENLRGKLESFAAVSQAFTAYGEFGKQLVRAYSEEFRDDPAREFLNQLNAELYLQVELDYKNLAEGDGRLGVYGNLVNKLSGSVSFADILTTLDTVISEEKTKAVTTYTPDPTQLQPGVPLEQQPVPETAVSSAQQRLTAQISQAVDPDLSDASQAPNAEAVEVQSANSLDSPDIVSKEVPYEG